MEGGHAHTVGATSLTACPFGDGSTRYRLSKQGARGGQDAATVYLGYCRDDRSPRCPDCDLCSDSTCAAVGRAAHW